MTAAAVGADLQDPQVGDYSPLIPFRDDRHDEYLSRQLKEERAQITREGTGFERQRVGGGDGT